MTILNFKEISKANIGGEGQDKFELFARDFFKFLGYVIVDEPDRGQDGGKDILIEEKREGIMGRTSTIRWLVSCKHFIHSKNSKSVGKDDEIDISDRVKGQKCNGFIGFYSTLPSSGLTKKLANLKEAENIDYDTYDYAKIEYFLLENERGKEIASRYFPKSYNEWIEKGQLAENMLQMTRAVSRYISNNKDLIISYLKELVVAQTVLFIYMSHYQKDTTGPNPEILANLIEELDLEINKLHKIFESKHIYLDNPDRDEVSQRIEMLSQKMGEELIKIKEHVL
ncbi:hypothetical protein COK21_27830 [Bacillus cereus]|nr:hypothetical protein COK21_27830 [Bacillus cereus]